MNTQSLESLASLGNLRMQNFFTGPVEYKAAEGLIYDVKKVTTGLAHNENAGQIGADALTTTIVSEAWVRWNCLDMPDTKFIFDAAAGQRLALIEAFLTKSDGRTYNKTLWMYNLDTRKELAMTPHKSSNIELVGSSAQPSNAAILQFVKEQHLRTNEKEEFQKNYDTKSRPRIKAIWAAITGVAALIGLAVYGWLGLVLAAAIGWIAGGLVSNRIGMNLLHSSISDSQRSQIQVQSRVNEIKKYCWNI